MFHAAWPVGHNSTEYDKYYAAQPGEIYKVTRYQSAYEPYIIYKKDGPPWYTGTFLLSSSVRCFLILCIHVVGATNGLLATEVTRLRVISRCIFRACHISSSPTTSLSTEITFMKKLREKTRCVLFQPSVTDKV
jgi:hypothetical protein